ncbi:CvpA family protein [Sediminispirochaeta smaragdinae]|jgi:membrane protein required for colicin V production|uniref:Colicin V production protein n=1 Tax=Sediminispirochaeta smaragdinae (strain DSM 11293 / JCM 15392 / SEBR 4228) TaxID=573413 RepID=E1R668_SEDSS|nr:CvpA family protein [Sediminispirochaeta smaragdinae]ADK80833.1 Colicin V production protein [Sediminispirochaeta smaragdinae DSM 11293]
MEFSAVDVVALIIVLVLGVRCAFRGFVAELMAFAAILLGLVAAVVFGGLVVPFAQRYIGDGFWTPIASFLAVFLVTYIVVKLFEGALYRLIDRVNLEKMDQALGFFLGIVEGVLLLAVLLFLIRIQPVFDPEPLLSRSFLVPFLEKLIPLGQGFIESALGESSV